MHKSLYIVVVFELFLLGGCNAQVDQEQNKTGTTKPLSYHNSTKEPDDKALKSVGITTSGDKIVIDTNKTKAFLKKMANILKSESEALQEKTADLGRKSFGIQKENGKIVIDLNKTQNTLQSVTNELEDVAKGLGDLFKNTK